MPYAKLALAGTMMVTLYTPAIAQQNPTVDCANPAFAQTGQCQTSPRADPTGSPTGGAGVGSAPTTGGGATGATGTTTGGTGTTGTTGSVGTGGTATGTGGTATGTGGTTGTNR